MRPNNRKSSNYTKPKLLMIGKVVEMTKAALGSGTDTEGGKD